MENTDVLTELKSDLKELEEILSKVVRSSVRQSIAHCVSNVKNEIEKLEGKTTKEKTSDIQNDTGKMENTNQLYNVKITNYGWDESEKFIKIYVSLKKVDQLKDEQIRLECTDASFKLTISNHMGRNHILQIMNLAHMIKPDQSNYKIKSDVVVLLRKEQFKTWGTLTEAQRKEKEAKDSKFSMDSSDTDTSDPSAGIMNLMKKMYDDGDDDMKRMIKKTWHDTRQKQGENVGEMPSF